MFQLVPTKHLVAGLFLIFLLSNCTNDYPAVDVGDNQPTPTSPPASTSACSGSTSPGSSSAVQPVDTLDIAPPRFSPDGGTFYFSVPVRLAADSLPPQALYEYSFDNGQSWQTGQQFTVLTGGKMLARLRVGNRPSRSRAVTFNLYYKRMLVIGNSIMSHLPDPSIGWLNSNGMAASAPDKDFVHLLNARLTALYPQVSFRLQSGGNFEREFGKSTYSLDEFNEPLQQFKPDLIILRIGENIDESAVISRNYETQLSQLLDRLATYGQPVKIVATTSVWSRPLSDSIIRRTVAGKGHTLVDLSCLVGQGQYFASQYANPGVAAHPNDAGMQRIADFIWEKIQ
ncbi:SGNH/GDSL hydrolase family protein [Spirosoma pomorum]